MKIKHFIFLSLLLALFGTMFLFLMGCEQSDLERRIEAWKSTYPDRTGDCMIYAMKRQQHYRTRNIRAKICHGYWKGEKHAWCEYQDNDKWLVDDPEIGNKGYPRDAYKTGNTFDYYFEWDGE